MRYRLLMTLCIVMAASAWAQVAGTAPASAPSAYDILGVSTSENTEEPSSGTATSDEASGTTDLVEDATVTADSEPADVENSSTETVDIEVSDSETADAETMTGLVPELGQTVPSGMLDEPAVADGQSVEAMDAEDEAILMDEILRLLAERDSLYEEIADLKAENAVLAESARDAGYYQARSQELEADIVRLEAALAEKEAALAAADARIAEISAQLAEEGERLADMTQKLADADAVIAASGGDQTVIDTLIAERDKSLAEKDALIAAADAELEELNLRLASAETELQAARAALDHAGSTSPVVETTSPDLSEAVSEAERKVAEMAAERDAAIAVRDAAIATRDAAETVARAAEAAKADADAARLEAEAALASALAAGAVVRETSVPVVAAPIITPPAVAPEAITVPTIPGKGYLSGWALDVAKFSKNLRSGFDASAARMGSWKIAGQTASQTDASQYFSRLELPLAQGKAATLYRFKARSTGKGWIGLGLHIFVDDIKKRRGYGEGKSLLVWFTRDKDARGDDATYLQLYRSDNDVVMERMFDAELEDGIESWRLVEVVYDPVAEYIAISVDGKLRAVYRTFFGRDSGATVSLRTLGGGGSFQDFSAWTE